MKAILKFFDLLGVLLLIHVTAAQAHWPNQAQHQFADLGEFQFEGGGSIKNLRMSYVTHGKLNAAKDNAILFIHGYNPPMGIDLGDNPGIDCGTYWNSLPTTFRFWGYSGEIKNVGFYVGDTNCDIKLNLNPVKIGRDVGIETIGQLFAWYIYDNYTKNGNSVSIVAHSMGGLISRAAIANTLDKQGGYPPKPLKIKSLITLGTPNGGFSQTALNGIDLPIPINCQIAAIGGFQCAEMTLGSPFLTKINQLDWYTSSIENRLHIGSYHDETVPGDSAIYGVYGTKVIYDEFPAYSHGGYKSDFSQKEDGICY